ncbi:MAG: xanthine dehydrogenase family protein molybdopterin-binding subunit [Desulfofustis sp.]|nr:xanthine dehydrogenase family protein molybdopterin-binding subunit [Desulfofustis sp.]
MHAYMTRRTFLAKSSLVIAGTVLSSRIELFNATPVQAAAHTPFKPHAFLEIGADETITVWVGQTNLGQGSHTGIPMVIADELDADWKTVQVKMAPAAEPFKDPVWHVQTTGGSTSIRHRWDMLRQVGAAARQMLVEAAAEQWQMPAQKCTAKEGKVFHPDGSSLSYGQLTEAAGNLAVPDNPTLKAPQDYTIIGTPRERVDIPDKVMGKTVYGIDFSIDNMGVAVLARPPYYGATPESHDADAAMAVKGVVKVVELDNSIGVCAETTYAAMQGREALNITWSKGSHPELNDETLDAQYQEHLTKPGAVAQNEGDVETAFAAAGQTVAQSYKLPYLSHAQVEPINCTAHVEKDRCRIWAPTQGQTVFQMTAAKLTGLPMDKVEVMTLPAGGGFGLRAEHDPVVESVLLSKALGRPVKVIWSREDDFANDYFRPANHSRIEAGLDNSGKVVAWSHKLAVPSVMTRLMPQFVKEGVDPDAVSGVLDMAYSVPNKRVEYVMMDLPIRVGFWRSVGYSSNVFIVESFMDELAQAAGADPVQFRLDHLEKGSRPYNILMQLAERAGWGDPLPEGRGRGIAVTTCFESTAAHVAEVSVGPDGKIKVDKMHCGINCGTAVYPDGIRAQAEAGVIMGMSVAFHERVRFKDGGVYTANYDEYQILRMSEVPEIEVHILEDGMKAGGIGEPVVPSVAPSIANAIFAATGVRLRELPFDTNKLSEG